MKTSKEAIAKAARSLYPKDLSWQDVAERALFEIESIRDEDEAGFPDDLKDGSEPSISPFWLFRIAFRRSCDRIAKSPPSERNARFRMWMAFRPFAQQPAKRSVQAKTQTPKERQSR